MFSNLAIALFVLILLLCGCGGGGSDGSANHAPTPVYRPVAPVPLRPCETTGPTAPACPASGAQ